MIDPCLWEHGQKTVGATFARKGWLLISSQMRVQEDMYVSGSSVQIILTTMRMLIIKSINFWDIMPCSPMSVNRRFGGTYRLHLQGRKNKRQETSKQAGDTPWTTWRYIPEVDILHNHCCGNLKSYMLIILLFSHPHDKHFREEKILPYPHYYFNLSFILYYM
jgi:hypothetical protein